jgi:hypothetical protein
MTTSSHRIKPLKPLLAAIGFILCISPAAGDSLETHHGNTITGEVQSFDPGGITIQSPLSLRAITVKATSLKHLAVSASNKLSPTHPEILTLTNGDQLPCKIISSERNNINISTWYAGDMSIDRAKVASIRFGITSENIIFTGNQPLKEWTHVSGNWTPNTLSNNYQLEGTGHLAQLLDLPDKARYHYDLHWKNTPNFAFRFFAENNSATSKQNAYELILNSEGLEIRRHLMDEDRTVRIASLDTPEIKELQKENTSLSIDLKVDKGEGLISLYLDSSFVGTWHDPHGPLDGNYVIFNNRSQQTENCIIENIFIASLGGDIQPRFYDPQAKSSDTDVVTDSEGENILGEFLSIETRDTEDKKLRLIVIESSESKSLIRIPEHRVSQLLFKKKKAQNPPTKSAYILALRNDGEIQINQPKISDEEITALHPILGPLQISRSALLSITSSANTSPDRKPTKAARITLLNGDKITGKLQTTEDDHITINAPYLREPASFKTSHILSAHIDKESHTQTPETYTRVRFHHRNQEAIGDLVIGDLQELNEDNIKIKTPYGDPITVKRSMVQSLNIISKQQGQYYGPNSLDEWETSDIKTPEKPYAWGLRDGTLTSSGANPESIGRDIGLSDSSHISFDISWANHLGLTLQLYSSDPKSREPSACYQFSLDKYAVTMITRSKGQEQGHRRQRFPQTFKPRLKKCRFDIYINRVTGTANIHLDGQHACIIQSPIPNQQGLGTALAFVSHNSRPIEISNISVSTWNGFITNDLQTENNEVGPENKSPHNILLINGDTIPCDVDSIIGDKIKVVTEYTPINIPIEKIKSIHWQDKREEPKKYRGDVRAWFHTGGFITLKLASIIDDKLTGYSQASGDAELNTEAFSRIDFNIYNTEANELRAKYLSE